MSSKRSPQSIYHSALLPPPSIVSTVYGTAPTSMHGSTLLPPTATTTSSSSVSRYSSSPPRSQNMPTTLLALQRKEKSLQNHLQSLLDAQSAGLLAGLSGGGHTDASSEGSSTPTAASVAGGSVMRASRASVVPVGQPRPGKQVSLRGARRGILSAMEEFAAVKAEEVEILDAEIAGIEEVWRLVEGWEGKRAGLRERIAGIEAEGDGRRVGELRSEAGRVEAEIVDLENRVMELKARHARLLEEADEVESAVQAKLSSYSASLSIVDSQVSTFLARPPPAVTSQISATGGKSRNGDGEANFLTLPPKRRTLEMAKSFLEGKRKEISSQRTAAEHERDALEDGAVVWEDVVSEVTSFERKLRSEMRALTRPSAMVSPPMEMSRSNFKPRSSVMGSARGQSNSSPGNGTSSNPAVEGMRGILRDMDNVIGQLESKLRLAEARGWRLLVCCVGAELEAFREGKVLLEETLRAAGLVVVEDQEESVDDGERDLVTGDQDGFDPLGVGGAAAEEFNRGLDHGLRELDDELRVHHSPVLSELRESRGVMPQGRLERGNSESEDDGPDPTLLVLHEDDTD